MNRTRCNQTLRYVSSGALCVLLGVLSGCGWFKLSEWSDQMETTVWADDGEQIAVVLYDFELKLAAGESALPERSYEESTIYTASPDAPEDLRAFGFSHAGRITNLHFMRSEGYLLSRRVVDAVPDSPQGYENSAVVFDKVGLDGKVTEITRSPLAQSLSCPGEGGFESDEVLVKEEILPSPDGKTLAWNRVVEACDQPTGTLEFLDASSLRPLGAPRPIDDELAIFVEGVLRVGWDSHGRFLVTRASGVLFSAWAYVPDYEPIFLGGIGWACFSPVTTSSWVSLDGYGARMTRAGHLTLTTEPLGGVFGCAQIPE